MIELGDVQEQIHAEEGFSPRVYGMVGKGDSRFNSE